jgi:hypothetical protein
MTSVINRNTMTLLAIAIFSGVGKLSINLFIYESGPIEEKIEDVLFM